MSDMQSSAQNVVELVRYLVTSLVDKPESVVISSSEESNHITVMVACDSEDIGKVIGRSGRTIKSIRTLARAAAANTNLFVDVDVEG